MKKRFVALLTAIVAVLILTCALCACSKRKVESYSLSDNAFPSEYKVDAPLDLSGAFVITKFTDGQSEKAQITADMVIGFDTSTTGSKTMTIKYNDYEKTVSYRVYNPENSSKEVITKARLTLSAYYAPNDEYVEYTISLEKEKLPVSAILFTLNGDASLGITQAKSNLTLTSSLPSSSTTYQSNLSPDGKNLTLLVFNAKGETLLNGGRIIKIKIDKGNKTPVRLKGITVSDAERDYYLPVSA